MQRSTILAGAVAAALGTGAAAPAFARLHLESAEFSPPCTPNVLACYANPYVASESAVGTNGAWINGGGDFWQYSATFGFGVAAGQSVFLRFDLSGGAKFGTPSGSGSPTVSYGATSANGASSSTLDVLPVAGGAGQSYAIFQVTAFPIGIPVKGSWFYLDEYYSTYTQAGVTVPNPQGNYTVHYAEYATASDAAAQTNPLYQSDAALIEFAQTLTASGQAGTPGVIDVASNDTLFTGGATVAPIGELAIGDLTQREGPTGTNLKDNAGHIPIVATTTSKTTLTVSGDFAAAPTTASGALDPAAVFLNSASNCAGTTLAAATTLTATQATFTLGNLALGTFSDTQATGYATVCYQVSGTAPIQFGVTYKGSYAPTGATGYTLQGSYPFTLATLTSNGAHAQVLNIPSGTTGGDAPYIRIYNTSSIAGPIRGTLYAQDGSVLYNGVLIPSLAPGQVQVLDAQQLQSLAGGSWSGRARLDVFGQIPAMDVQALVRTANGTLVNVSSKAPGPPP